jgi:hypothetical protein
MSIFKNIILFYKEMREQICMTCSSVILEYDNLRYYLKIKPSGFLKNNYDIFCRCNKQGLTKERAEKLEREMEDYWKINYKLKK